MSRLAEAFRRAVAGGQAGSVSRQPPATWNAVLGPFAGAHVPWDINGPAAPSPAARAASHPGPAARIATAPGTPATAGISAADEVSDVVRRIFDPGTAGGRRRTILFAALDADSASARVSASVATLLARQTSAAVCLVEGNLRSNALPALCGVGAAGAGLSDMLLDGVPLRGALTPLSDNLWLLGAGGRGAEAVSRLSAERLAPCVHELRAAFDYVIVNAPAATLHRDAAILAPLVDGVVLVVSASSTRREAARHTVEHLQQAGAVVLGAVLADRTFPIPEALYKRL
jgi:protein-tyrosine kinase